MTHFITISKPSQVNSVGTRKEIESLINSGVKTNEINLLCKFLAPDHVVTEIYKTFRVMKNRAAFNRDMQC